MKVTQEKLPDSQIGLEIEVPADSSKKVYENVVSKLTKTVNIPGFRRGKVPRQIVIQRLGSEYIKASVVEELVEENIRNAIQQEKLPVIGNISLRSKMEDLISGFQPGEPLVFSIAADVFPDLEYEPDGYKQLTVQAEEIKFELEQVDEWLENQREKRATFVPVEERPAAMGDKVIFDYQGFLPDEQGEAGEAIPEVKGEDFEATLEEGRFVAGVVEGIVAMAIGDEKLIPITFPEDYPLEPVAGKDVLFQVNLKEIKAQELPELDDDFAEEISEFETLAELRADLEKNFREQAEERTASNVRSAIKKALADVYTGSLPATLVKQETEMMFSRAMGELERMGIDPEQLLGRDDSFANQLKERSRPEAIANVKSELMITEIARKEELEPSEEEVQSQAEELRQQFRGEKIDEARLMSYVQSNLTEEKVLEWLRGVVSVELVPEGTLEQPELDLEEDDAEEEELTLETAED